MRSRPTKPIRDTVGGDPAANLREPRNWLAGIALPRLGSRSEIANTHRQLLDLRPTIPLFAAIGALIWAGVTLWHVPLTASIQGAWLAAGGVLTTLFAVFGLREAQPKAGEVADTARGLVTLSAAAGLLWSTLPVISDIPFALVLSISMLVLGIVALSPMPLAAMAYMVAFAVTLVTRLDGFASSAAAVVVLSGALTLYLAGRRTLIERVEGSMRDLGEQRVRRLCATFETCGSGWFWETDVDGRITYISPSFGAAHGTTNELLIGRPLGDIISLEVEDPDEAATSLRTLEFHLQGKLPFHDVVIPVLFPLGIQWWSIAGTPIYSQHGHFEGFTGIGGDLTDVRRSEDRAMRLARFDPLTGLANRITIRETLETALLSHGGVVPHRCALLLLDLDRFKSVNDTLGHPVGDKLLEQVADRLGTLVGADGRVGRLGGDEFAIVVRDAETMGGLSAFAQRIIDYLSAPYTVEGHRIIIGASVGIAIGPDNGHSVDALMRNADLALYAAKSDGRGKHRFYEGGMHRNAETRRQIENDLRGALVGNGLSLNFQPIVETASETLVGFEALVRWHHPRHGEISPASFIPIAEETGLIDGIGEWVLRNACMVAAKWPEHIGIAVNLSPIQVTNPELPALVMNALAQAGLAPERLELEITESVFLEENPATRATLQRLGAIGVRLTLDDFGTGYSGFAYLTKAPFKKIKIDRSFVSGAAERGGQKAAIVKAIVALADSLGMITTAEGVETHDDLDIIRRIGCTQVQGFIFGKAVPWAEAGILARSEAPIAPNGVKSNRPRRIAMLRRATILHNGRRRSARLRNTSDTGAMFEARWLPRPDDRVTTFVEGQQPRSGIVRWVEEDRFGIHYDEQIIASDIENEERAA